MDAVSGATRYVCVRARRNAAGGAYTRARAHYDASWLLSSPSRPALQPAALALAAYRIARCVALDAQWHAGHVSVPIKGPTSGASSR